jgi:hypothetical protein
VEAFPDFNVLAKIKLTNPVKFIMNKPCNSTWKMAASLALAALLALGSSASAQLTITTANQIGTANTYPFTPTWTPASDSLIAGLAPSATAGNFTLDLTTRNVNTLTSGGSLAIGTLPGDAGPDPIGNTTTSSNYVTCGNRTAAPAAGSLIVYTLPASANGYNLTNITVFSGWKDNGRDAQAYTVLYSTVVNTNSFIYLATVTYNPTVPGSTPSANQSVINDASGGVIASNVAAVKFVMNFPTVENGWTGYGAITVQGTAASSVATLSVTTATQSGISNTWPFTPTWTLETDSLIAGNTTGAGNVTTNGNFNLESQAGTRDVNTLTLNTTSLTIDNVGSPTTTSPNYVTCGGGSGSGSSIIYALTNSPNGSDVTNIVVYNGWANNGRDGQYYKVSYSTILAPTTFIPITTVFYLPSVAANTPVANRVAISFSTGAPLAMNVANLKFDFASPTSAGSFNNGYQGYAQIIVEGTNSAPPTLPPSPFLTQDTQPTHAETVVGDQVVFTAAYSNAPPANLQWQQVVTGPAATNNINAGVVTVTNNGVITSTLTLNNVQLTNSASYRLKAVNATNGSAAPSYSAAAPLAVGTPTTVGNVVVQYAGQTGPSTFYPAWTIATNTDLIFGFPTDGSGNPGTATAGAGNYGLEAGLAGDPTILADGALGDSKPAMVSCGPLNGAGLSMTYTLNTSSATNGFDLTNIVVYGGWPDDGRNEQKYQILYSTVAAPATFSSIGTFDYNPSFTSGEPNATRVTLIPATGVLAQNVAAVQINWNLQGSVPKNGWEGYSEITISGTNAAPVAVLTQDINPLTAEDVVGSSLTLTAAFSGATSYQWQKNGTNISGATSPTLMLNNLQLSDTATNGGYRLTALNAAGTSMTRGCALIVHPAPTAVANVVVAFANQTSDAGTFTPTWDTSSFAASLINGSSPSDFGPGNFLDPDPNPVSQNLAGGLPVLTDGDYGAIVNGGAHPAFATCGSTAGQYVTYTLPASANGYDLTNILIASGWNDDGRNANWSTVSYSTVTNPAIFLPLAVVTNRPTLGTKSEIRATLTPAAGVLASNVYAVMFSFEWPQGIPNGYSGFSQINVFGSPSATPPPVGPVITVQHEETNNTWTVETPNLIANQLPSSHGPGVFTLEGCTEAGLTDGVLSFGGNANSASCGDDGTAVPWIVFNSSSGWNLTNIVVYTLWHDYGRDGQFYNLSYSTLSDPTTFLPLASVVYNPFVPHDGRASGNRVAIAPPSGQTMLATNVYAVKFDFTPQGSQDFGWSGYTEIVLQGSNLAATTAPVINSAYISGGNLILTGTGGTPNYAYDVLTTTNLSTPLANWTVLTTGVTDGSGAISNAIPVIVANPAGFFRLRTP